MIGAMRYHEVFRTVIWVTDLKPETHEPLNRGLMAAIGEVSAERDRVLVGSNWQTRTDLHRRPAFAEITRIFESASKSVLDFLEIDYTSFAITGCWANVAPTGTKHRAHTHPNNYLSGVYYVQAPPGADVIEFSDPRLQAGVISPRVKRFNAYNGEELKLDIKPGRLVMFHSWLVHSVPVNQSAQDRVSMSFDVMFPDFFEMSVPKFEGNARPHRGEG